MCIASLVLGILSIIFCWIPNFNIIFSIIAFIIACVAYSKNKNNKTSSNRGMAITGVILSTISICIILIATVAFTIM